MTASNNDDQTIIDLQSRIAFQEDLISELNAQVAEQSRKIEQMTLQFQQLNKKLNDLAYWADQQKSAESSVAQERPPHY